MASILKHVLVVCVGCTVGQAMATITLWSGSSSDVFINQATGTVTILAPGTFKMHSVANGSLAPINHIFVADGVTGAVEVHVRRNPVDNAGIEGASDVGEIDLTNDQSTLTGALVELHITGDLGTLGPIVVTSLAGTTTVVGDVLDSITVSEYFTSTLTVGSLGILNLTRDCCDFPHSGSITVTDDFSGSISAIMRLTGAMHFCGDMGGTLDLFEYSGQMDVEGDLTGTIEVEQLSGDVRVHGRLASSGQIKGPFAQSSLSGSVTVYGDIEGGLISYPVVNSLSSEYQGASIHVLGSLTGSRTSPLINIGTLGTVVAVNGTLTDANTNGPEIQVTSFTAGSYVRGAISIDYDANGLDDPTAGKTTPRGATGRGSKLEVNSTRGTKAIRKLSASGMSATAEVISIQMGQLIPATHRYSRSR